VVEVPELPSLLLAQGTVIPAIYPISIQFLSVEGREQLQLELTVPGPPAAVL
jgi:hypothetical protein